MERWLPMLQASSSTVSHVLGQTNAARIGIILQYFMNAPQYVFVKAQLMIRFQTRIFHILRPAHGCAMLLAPQKLLDKREKGLLTSQCEQLGWFSDMSVVSKDNGKVTGNVTSVFWDSATCLGTNQCCWGRNHEPGWFMNVPQYLLVEGFRQPFPIYTCNLHAAVPCKLHSRNF